MSVEFFRHENMLAAPLSEAAPRTIFATEDGIMFCYGTAAYTVLEADTDYPYAPGCIYIKSLAAGSSEIYVNEGTKAAPNFDKVTIA